MTDTLQYLPRYTLADYERWEGDWELWEGFPVSLNPPNTVLHQYVLGRLAYRLMCMIKDANLPCEVIHHCDWRIDDYTVVRPDLQVFCEPVETEWVEQTPALVAEILSPQSAAKDRGYKRSLYARQGVQYYLIVDPDAKTVEALVLEGDAYAAMGAGDGVLSFDLHDGCAVSLEVASLWS